MKAPKLSSIILAGGLFIFAGCATSHHCSTAWEYRVVTAQFGVPVQSSSLEERLNKAAAEGYSIESVQTVPAPQNGFPTTVVILKRAKH